MKSKARIKSCYIPFSFLEVVAHPYISAPSSGTPENELSYIRNVCDLASFKAKMPR